MNNDKVIFEDWEMEKLNELVKYTSEKNLKEKALKEGHEQGHKQGHAEGHAKGLEEGIAEGEKKLRETVLEHIKNMLKENMDIEIISKITNKTKEDILEIKKTLEL